MDLFIFWKRIKKYQYSSFLGPNYHIWALEAKNTFFSLSWQEVFSDRYWAVPWKLAIQSFDLLRQKSKIEIFAVSGSKLPYLDNRNKKQVFGYILTKEYFLILVDTIPKYLLWDLLNNVENEKLPYLGNWGKNMFLNIFWGEICFHSGWDHSKMVMIRIFLDFF